MILTSSTIWISNGSMPNVTSEPKQSHCLKDSTETDLMTFSFREKIT